MQKRTQWLTRTAILLALTVGFQSLRAVIPKIILPGMGELDQYIIGSLVNACLIISAITVGASGGITISILAPVIAWLQGEIGFPIMVPFVALGNVIIVLCVALLYNKNKIAAFITGIIAKFLWLYISITYIVIPIITPNLQGPKAEAVPKLLSFKFSWPQIVTATIGSIIAYSVLPLLGRAYSDDTKHKNAL